MCPESRTAPTSRGLPPSHAFTARHPASHSPRSLHPRAGSKPSSPHLSLPVPDPATRAQPPRTSRGIKTVPIAPSPPLIDPATRAQPRAPPAGSKPSPSRPPRPLLIPPPGRSRRAHPAGSKSSPARPPRPLLIPPPGVVRGATEAEDPPRLRAPIRGARVIALRHRRANHRACSKRLPEVRPGHESDPAAVAGGTTLIPRDVRRLEGDLAGGDGRRGVDPDRSSWTRTHRRTHAQCVFENVPLGPVPRAKMIPRGRGRGESDPGP